jgi:hypothetical protein
MAAVGAALELEPDIAAVAGMHGPVTDCLSWQILRTTHAKAGSLAADVSAAGMQHLLVVLENTAAAHIVVEIGPQEAARLAVLVVEDMSSDVVLEVEDTSSDAEPVVVDTSSVAVWDRNYLLATLAGCRQSDDQVVELGIALYVEAVQSVAHHNLLYVEPAQAVERRSHQWTGPGWEFAHVQ